MSNTIYKLYIKIHNITGLKYLGYTKSKDVNSYKGSGVYWLRHINKHGYNVTTITLFESSDINEIKDIGLFYSEFFNVVKSNKWANLVVESGQGMYNLTDEIKEKIKQTLTNKYGVDNIYKLVSYIKECVYKKYGVYHYVQTEEYNIKRKNTCMLRYGVEHHMKNLEIKNKVNLSKAETLSKLGITSVFQLDSIKEKIKETNIKKYGVEHFSKTDEFKTKFSLTYQNKSDEEKEYIKEKIKETNIKKYGVDNPFKKESNCPHCGKHIKNYGAAKRWHYDNCKLKS